MEVILLKDTDFGDKGSVAKVADGYARNYLFPNRIALEKTPGNLKIVAVEANQKKKKLAKEKEAVETVAKKLNDAKPIVIKAKGGEGC